LLKHRNDNLCVGALFFAASYRFRSDHLMPDNEPMTESRNAYHHVNYL